VSVEDDKCSRRSTTIRTKENVQKFGNLYMKTIANRSMSLQTPLGSVMVFARANVQGDQAPSKQQKMLQKFRNSSTKTITEQSMSLHITILNKVAAKTE
jgi:hypothetical protein